MCVRVMCNDILIHNGASCECLKNGVCILTYTKIEAGLTLVVSNEIG